MILCNKCGQKIRCIAINYNKSVVCNEKEIEIVTITGHYFKGFLPHKCELKETTENERK